MVYGYLFRNMEEAGWCDLSKCLWAACGVVWWLVCCLKYVNPFRYLHGVRQAVTGAIHATLTALYSVLRGRATNEPTAPPLQDWVHQHLGNMGIHVTNFDTDWVDGIALCALVESLCPGAFPKYDHLKPTLRLNNCRLALKLVQKHFVTTTVISPEEIADGNNEMKMLRLLSLIRSSTSMKRASTTLRSTSSDTSQTTAKGRGLEAGLVGKIAKFNILYAVNVEPQITIEIQGPSGEYHLETISKIEYKYHHPQYVEKQETTVNEKKEDDLSWNINKIQFEYHKISDGQIEVNYIPKSVGKYMVHIKWCGIKVAGSPFSVIIADNMDELNRITKGRCSRRVVENPKYRKPVLQRLLSQGKLDVDSMHASSSAAENRDKVSAVLRRTSTVSRSLSKADTSHVTQKTRGTIKRRRVLKKIMTSDGREIIIQDTCSTPSASSQDSGDDKKGNMMGVVSKTSLHADRPLRHMNAVVGAQMQAYDALADALADTILQDAMYIMNGKMRTARLENRRRTFENRCQSFGMLMQRRRSSTEKRKRIASTSALELPADDTRIQRSPFIVCTDQPGTVNKATAVANVTSSQEKPKATVGMVTTENNVKRIDETTDIESQNMEVIQQTETTQYPPLSGELSNSSKHVATSMSDISNGLTSAITEQRNTVISESQQNGFVFAESRETGSRASPDSELFFNSAKGMYESYSDDGRTQYIASSFQVMEGRSAFRSPSPLTVKSENSKLISQTDKSTQVRYTDIKSETGWCRRSVYLSQRMSDYIHNTNDSPVPHTNSIPPEKTPYVCVYDETNDESNTLQDSKSIDIQRSQPAIKTSPAMDSKSIKTELNATRTKPPHNGHKPIRRVPYRGKITLDPRLISSDPNAEMLGKFLKAWQSLQSSSDSDIIRTAKQKFKRASNKTKQKTKRVRFSKRTVVYRRSSSKSSSRGSLNRSKDDPSSSLEGKTVPRRKYKENRANPMEFDLAGSNARERGEDVSAQAEVFGEGAMTRRDRRLASTSSMIAQAGDEVDCDSMLSEDASQESMMPIAEEQHFEPPHFGVEGGTRDDLLTELSLFRRLSLPVIKVRPSLKDLSDSWHFTTIAGSGSNTADSLLHELSINTPISSSAEPSRTKQLSEGQVFTFDEEDVRSYTFDSQTSNAEDHITPLNIETLNSAYVPNSASIPKSAPALIDASLQEACDPFPEVTDVFTHGIDVESHTDNSPHMNGLQNGDINGDINSMLEESDNSQENEISKTDAPKATLCYAFGAGLHYGQVNAKNNFQVRTKDAGNGCLAVSITGPRPYTVTETTVTYTGDDLYEVIYEVTQPGFYIVNIKWSDVTIPDSPYICKVTF